MKLKFVHPRSQGLFPTPTPRKTKQIHFSYCAWLWILTKRHWKWTRSRSAAQPTPPPNNWIVEGMIFRPLLDELRWNEINFTWNYILYRKKHPNLPIEIGVKLVNRIFIWILFQPVSQGWQFRNSLLVPEQTWIFDSWDEGRSVFNTEVVTGLEKLMEMIQNGHEINMTVFNEEPRMRTLLRKKGEGGIFTPEILSWLSVIGVCLSSQSEPEKHNQEIKPTNLCAPREFLDKCVCHVW